MKKRTNPLETKAKVEEKVEPKIEPKINKRVNPLELQPTKETKPEVKTPTFVIDQTLKQKRKLVFTRINKDLLERINKLNPGVKQNLNIENALLKALEITNKEEYEQAVNLLSGKEINK